MSISVSFLVSNVPELRTDSPYLKQILMTPPHPLDTRLLPVPVEVHFFLRRPRHVPYSTIPSPTSGSPVLLLDLPSPAVTSTPTRPRPCSLLRLSVPSPVGPDPYPTPPIPPQSLLFPWVPRPDTLPPVVPVGTRPLGSSSSLPPTRRDFQNASRRVDPDPSDVKCRAGKGPSTEEEVDECVGPTESEVPSVGPGVPVKAGPEEDVVEDIYLLCRYSPHRPSCSSPPTATSASRPSQWTRSTSTRRHDESRNDSAYQNLSRSKSRGLCKRSSRTSLPCPYFGRLAPKVGHWGRRS